MKSQMTFVDVKGATTMACKSASEIEDMGTAHE